MPVCAVKQNCRVKLRSEDKAPDKYYVNQEPAFVTQGGEEEKEIATC